MYSDVFCKVYNEFGWNYFPEAFGEELLKWIRSKDLTVKTSLDLACGTGVLCEALHREGIRASGMDFSEGMIEIARKGNPEIEYEVADMILYRPEKKFDLVTCTGDALNHILKIEDVGQIFANVRGYLNDGGYFVFDVLNEKEATEDEPFDLEFSERIRAQFRITKPEPGIIQLRTSVFEDGEFRFEEVITERVHDVRKICEMLKSTGFTVEKCGHSILDDAENQATTWYIIAKKD